MLNEYLGRTIRAINSKFPETRKSEVWVQSISVPPKPETSVLALSILRSDSMVVALEPTRTVLLVFAPRSSATQIDGVLRRIDSAFDLAFQPGLRTGLWSSFQGRREVFSAVREHRLFKNTFLIHNQKWHWGSELAVLKCLLSMSPELHAVVDLLLEASQVTRPFALLSLTSHAWKGLISLSGAEGLFQVLDDVGLTARARETLKIDDSFGFIAEPILELEPQHDDRLVRVSKAASLAILVAARRAGYRGSFVDAERWDVPPLPGLPDEGVEEVALIADEFPESRWSLRDLPALPDFVRTVLQTVDGLLGFASERAIGLVLFPLSVEGPVSVECVAVSFLDPRLTQPLFDLTINPDGSCTLLSDGDETRVRRDEFRSAALKIMSGEGVRHRLRRLSFLNLRLRGLDTALHAHELRHRRSVGLDGVDGDEVFEDD